MNMLKKEMYKTLNSIRLLAVIAASIILIIIMFSGYKSEVDFRAMDPTDRIGTRYTLEDVKKWVGLPDSDAETIMELFREKQPMQFRGMMSFGVTFLLSLFWPAFFICYDFKHRIMNNSLYIGASRTGIALAKITVSYIAFAIISLISLLFGIWIYAPNFFSDFPAGYIWRCIGIHILLDMSSMSLPMLLAFLLKKWGLTVIANIPVAVLFLYMNIAAVKSGTYLPLPSSIIGMESLWQQNANTELIAAAILIPVVFIAACSVLSCYSFSRSRFR